MVKTEKKQMALIHSSSRSVFHHHLSSMMVFQYRQIQSFHLDVILCHSSSVLCAALWSSVTCFKCAIQYKQTWIGKEHHCNAFARNTMHVKSPSIPGLSVFLSVDLIIELGGIKL